MGGSRRLVARRHVLLVQSMQDRVIDVFRWDGQRLTPGKALEIKGAGRNPSPRHGPESLADSCTSRPHPDGFVISRHVDGQAELSAIWGSCRWEAQDGTGAMA